MPGASDSGGEKEAIQDAMGWLDYHLHMFQELNPVPIENRPRAHPIFRYSADCHGSFALSLRAA